ncbi:MAG: hypothetical protein Q8908_03150, partial [Bacteroidota bacterium]|nr:hypothetical protein [Bacteroidota bacterium]
KQYIGLKQKLVYGSYTISLDSIWVNVKDKDYKDVDIFAGLTVGHPAIGIRKAVCSFVKRGEQYYNRDAFIPAMNIALRFEMTSDKPRTIELGAYEQKPDFIVLKAIIFPWINMLWLGAIIMLSGLVLALYKRIV